MKNFTIILFILFLVFLLISLFSANQAVYFTTLFLAFFVALICLGAYQGKFRGVILALFFMFLPFLLEYLLSKTGWSLFNLPIIKRLSLSRLNLPVTVNNLFLIIKIPVLLICALIFSQKIKLSVRITTYHRSFLACVASVLFAIHFVAWGKNTFAYAASLKWLIIGLLVNFLLVYFYAYAFKHDTSEQYKELPIIIYLSIFATSALVGMDSLQLLTAVLITFYYVYLLYKEFHLRKINAPVL